MATRESLASAPTPDFRGTAGAAGGSERAILLTVALATTLAPLNSTMIAVALPAIIAHFRVGLDQGSWLITGYLVTMAALQPVAGKLGDRLGRRNLLLGGLLYFGIASLGAALAPNLPVLLAWRFQQAVAGAIALPNGAALVREVVPAHRRAGGYGIVGAAAGIAAAAGPPLGGLLTGVLGWQAIFWVNVPLVLAALLLGWHALPRTARRSAASAFDVPGAVLLLAMLAGFSLLLKQLGSGGTAPRRLVGIAVLVVLALIFYRQELRHPDPVLRPGFFRVRAFAAACAAVALSNLAMYSTLLALPELLAHAPGWDSARVGLTLTGLSAATVVCSPLGGRLADRVGRQPPVVLGLLLFALAVLPLAFRQTLPASGVLLAILILAGMGGGLSSAGMQTAAVEALGPRDAGAAAGIFSTSRYFGSIAGASVLPALLAGATGSRPTLVFAMIVPAAFLAVVAGLWLQPGKQQEPAADIDTRPAVP